jgi:hypothetical protein
MKNCKILRWLLIRLHGPFLLFLTYMWRHNILFSYCTSAACIHFKGVTPVKCIQAQNTLERGSQKPLEGGWENVYKVLWWGVEKIRGSDRGFFENLGTSIGPPPPYPLSEVEGGNGTFILRFLFVICGKTVKSTCMILIISVVKNIDYGAKSEFILR